MPALPTRSSSGANWAVFWRSVLLLTLLDHVGEGALPAVVPVEVHGHEDTRAAELVRALLPEPLDLVVRVHLVELQHCELHLLPLVLDLLRLGVGLLLALLRAAVEAERQEDRGLLLQPALDQGRAVEKLLPAKDQALLLLRDPLGFRHKLLHLIDAAHTRQGERLPPERLHEDLHRSLTVSLPLAWANPLSTHSEPVPLEPKWLLE